MSTRRGQGLALTILLGICALFGLAAIVLVALAPGETGRARVLGPVPGTNQTSVEVLDGPDPKTWRMPTDEVGFAEPGDVIDVALRGECKCVPYEANEGADVALVAGIILLVIFAIVLRSFLRYRQDRTHQRAAANVLVANARCTPVFLRPVLQGKPKRLRVWADLWVPDGVWIGHLDLGLLFSPFDPTARWWLVGEPTVGSAVALVSEGRRQVILPCTPLRAGLVEEPPWSAAAVDAVQWTAPAAATAAPGLPTHGRVSVGSIPSDGTNPDRDALVARHRSIVQGAAIVGMFIWFGGIAGIWLGVPLIVVFPLALLLQFAVLRFGRRHAARILAEGIGLPDELQPWSSNISLAVLQWGTKSGFAPLWRGQLPDAAA